MLQYAVGANRVAKCYLLTPRTSLALGGNNMWRGNYIKLLIAAAMVWPVTALAQTYPSRPIVMVVPFAAGGSFDVMGRILAVRMSEILGQQVAVENTTRAGGISGVTRSLNDAPHHPTNP